MSTDKPVSRDGWSLSRLRKSQDIDVTQEDHGSVLKYYQCCKGLNRDQQCVILSLSAPTAKVYFRLFRESLQKPILGIFSDAPECAFYAKLSATAPFASRQALFKLGETVEAFYATIASRVGTNVILENSSVAKNTGFSKRGECIERYFKLSGLPPESAEKLRDAITSFSKRVSADVAGTHVSATTLSTIFSTIDVVGTFMSASPAPLAPLQQARLDTLLTQLSTRLLESDAFRQALQTAVPLTPEQLLAFCVAAKVAAPTQQR